MRERRVRDARYLAWLRTQPCAACAAPPPSEASHHGPRGMGQKADDDLAIPLCRRCHRSWHDTSKVFGRDHLDRERTRTWLSRTAEQHRRRYGHHGGDGEGNN